MRILYGVNGEGLGPRHALAGRHRPAARRATTSAWSRPARAFRVPARAAAARRRDLRPVVRHGRRARSAAGRRVRHNLVAAPRELPATVRHWLGVVHDVAARRRRDRLRAAGRRSTRAARTSRSCRVDNIHMLDRCHHDDGDRRRRARGLRDRARGHAGDDPDRRRLRHHHVLPAAVARGRTTLVPPILRPEVVDGRARRAASTCSSTPAAATRCSTRCARPACRAASTACATARRPARATARSSSARARTDGFLDDLRTARAVITGGGFSLLSEAVYLRKPVLVGPAARPVRAAHERPLPRARGLRACAPAVGPETLAEFLARAAGVRATRSAATSRTATRRRSRRSRRRVTAAAADDRRDRRQARRVARRAVR